MFLFHAVILLLVGGYLRAWSMMNESPSFEEVMAGLISLTPPRDYIASAAPDFSPPIYYLLAHSLVSEKGNLDWLRLLSIAAGTLAPIILYVLGRRHFSEWAAILAAYLLALNPLHIYYSQEAQPAALFTLLSIPAFFSMIRSAESNRWRDWIRYDIFVILLLHCQREAVFFVVAFPIVQFCKAVFFPPVENERRIRRFQLVQGILLNHFIIIALSLPWLWVMTNKVPWSLDVPTPADVGAVFTHYLLVGMTNWRLIPSWSIAVILIGLLLPPIIKSLRRLDFRTFSAAAVLLLTLLLPYVYSQFETPRFSAPREAMTASVFFALSVGILLGRCNPLVRSIISAAFFGVFVVVAAAQARVLQKTSSTDMLNAIIRDEASPEAVVAFWPDYTVALGDFWEKFYGKKFNNHPAGEVLKRWADLGDADPIYFVISQFPSHTAHLYTFQGALTQFAESKVLWQDGLNTVIKAEKLNQQTLDQWYDDPRSLRIFDQPSSSTQFIFTPGHKLFQDEQFAHDRLDLSYESSGHRFVWSTKAQVRIEPKVMLAPGSYVLKLHCSPDFEQPELKRTTKRTVSIELRTGEDRRRVTLSGPETVTLNFSTDTEIDKLPITITVDKVHQEPAPLPGTYGIKIYSVAIDSVDHVGGQF